MRRIDVELGARSYPVYVGSGLLSADSLLSQHLRGRSALLVTDETVGPLYHAVLTPALRAVAYDIVVLPDGEAYKDLQHWEQILDRLVAGRYPRDSAVIALGGGVVGDIAGFAAACYMRGVDFVQCPTTLLAQVDASVGGKTGVNHAAGKNLIGAFHQPRAVIADVDTLATLPARELAAGCAEVVKYGLLGDASFFAWLEGHAEQLRDGDTETLTRVVATSCAQKAEIVAADEREGGRRALLNLGHTFAHALETATEYRRLLHGEAVAIGMTLAAELSQRLGLCTPDVAERTAALLERLGLPTEPPPELSAERLVALMYGDKKTRSGRLRLVLLDGLGRARVAGGIDDAALIELWRSAGCA